MTFAPRFSPDGKNNYEFCGVGNSDIYTGFGYRVVEGITNHSSIDTSPHFHQMENLLLLTLTEAAYSKFVGEK